MIISKFFAECKLVGCLFEQTAMISPEIVNQPSFSTPSI